MVLTSRCGLTRRLIIVWLGGDEAPPANLDPLFRDRSQEFGSSMGDGESREALVPYIGTLQLVRLGMCCIPKRTTPATIYGLHEKSQQTLYPKRINGNCSPIAKTPRKCSSVYKHLRSHTRFYNRILCNKSFGSVWSNVFLDCYVISFLLFTNCKDGNRQGHFRLSAKTSKPWNFNPTNPQYSSFQDRAGILSFRVMKVARGSGVGILTWIRSAV